MRNSTLIKSLGLAALLIVSGNASAQTQLRKANPYAPIPWRIVTPIRSHASIKTLGKASAGIQRVPQKAQIQQTELVSEDFNRVTGDITTDTAAIHFINHYALNREQVDPDLWLANTLYGTSNDISTDYVNAEGWQGDYVAEANGAVALISPGAAYQLPAWIMTPAQDYSGSVTVTLRAKKYPGYKGNVNITGYVSNADGSFAEKGADANTTFRIFGSDEGWQYYTWTFDAYNANPNNRISFLTYDKVIIDDINVKVSADNFVAEPILKGITDVKDSSFTANWYGVRAANTYLLGLKKKVWASGQDSVKYYFDFNDGKVPTEMSTDGSVVDFKGEKVLAGDTITFPMNNAKYNKLKFKLGVIPSATPGDDSEGYIEIQTLKDGVWTGGSYYQAPHFEDTLVTVNPLYSSWTGDESGKYDGLRLVVDGMPEGYKIAVDSVALTTGRPFDFETIVEPDGWLRKFDDGSYENYYVSTRGDKPVTSFTFDKLEPDAEYYYSVIARRYTTNSTYTWTHAFCLPAPVATKATDQDERGSYTANWTGPVKATRYTVTNYGVYNAKKDVANYPLIDEDFSLVNSSVTSCTDPADPETLNNDYNLISLDAYTKLPGWEGVSNTVAQGYLGCGQASYFVPAIYTPDFEADNDSVLTISLKAAGGTQGDYITLSVNNNKDYLVGPFDANGQMDIEGILPESGKTMFLRISSYSYAPFMLDELKLMQNLKAGALVFTPLKSVTVGADTLSYTFTGLDDSYDYYAYDVKALQDLDGETATSVSSNRVITTINPNVGPIVTGIQEIGNNQKAGIVKIVGRYSLDGRRVNESVKGVQILKLSDGRTIKAIVK